MNLIRANYPKLLTLAKVIMIKEEDFCAGQVLNFPTFQW